MSSNLSPKVSPRSSSNNNLSNAQDAFASKNSCSDNYNLFRPENFDLSKHTQFYNYHISEVKEFEILLEDEKEQSLELSKNIEESLAQFIDNINNAFKAQEESEKQKLEELKAASIKQHFAWENEKNKWVNENDTLRRKNAEQVRELRATRTSSAIILGKKPEEFDIPINKEALYTLYNQISPKSENFDRKKQKQNIISSIYDETKNSGPILKLETQWYCVTLPSILASLVRIRMLIVSIQKEKIKIKNETQASMTTIFRILSLSPKKNTNEEQEKIQISNKVIHAQIDKFENDIKDDLFYIRKILEDCSDLPIDKKKDLFMDLLSISIPQSESYEGLTKTFGEIVDAGNFKNSIYSLLVDMYKENNEANYFKEQYKKKKPEYIKIQDRPKPQNLSLPTNNISVQRIPIEQPSNNFSAPSTSSLESSLPDQNNLSPSPAPPPPMNLAPPPAPPPPMNLAPPPAPPPPPVLESKKLVIPRKSKELSGEKKLSSLEKEKTTSSIGDALKAFPRNDDGTFKLNSRVNQVAASEPSQKKKGDGSISLADLTKVKLKSFVRAEKDTKSAPTLQATEPATPVGWRKPKPSENPNSNQPTRPPVAPPPPLMQNSNIEETRGGKQPPTTNQPSREGLLNQITGGVKLKPVEKSSSEEKNKNQDDGSLTSVLQSVMINRRIAITSNDEENDEDWDD